MTRLRHLENSGGAKGVRVAHRSEVAQGWSRKDFGMTIEIDFRNPNREPVISLMDLARLSDKERAEGYRDGAAGLPCGDNRCGRSGTAGGRAPEMQATARRMATSRIAC